MMRVGLFIATNLAVMLMVGLVSSIFLGGRVGGGGVFGLMLMSAVMGFTGAIISLLLSKFMAKRSTGAKVIENPANQAEAWLVDTVRELARKANIGMPEVAIYEGGPNAFATGAFKNSSLVAVSTGLLQDMTKEEVEAVLAHEISHVANGDMVTLTLVQGVMNTFVYFFARIAGMLVDSWLSRGRDQRQGSGVGYTITVFIAQMVFGVLAGFVVAWFSRLREFRADEGAARLMGDNRPMINALARLGNLHPQELPKSLSASGIAGGMSNLMATHPPLEVRIQALQKWRQSA